MVTLVPMRATTEGRIGGSPLSENQLKAFSVAHATLLATHVGMLPVQYWHIVCQTNTRKNKLRTNGGGINVLSTEKE